MSVNIKFESRKIDRTNLLETQEITFYSSSLEELKAEIEQNYPEDGDSIYGHVTRNHFYQQGPAWYCDVSAETQYGGSPSRHPPDPRSIPCGH